MWKTIYMMMAVTLMVVCLFAWHKIRMLKQDVQWSHQQLRDAQQEAREAHDRTAKLARRLMEAVARNKELQQKVNDMVQQLEALKQPQSLKLNRLHALFVAIRTVETGDPNVQIRKEGGTQFYVGDRGKSQGPYQIGVAHWADSGIGHHYDYQKYVNDPIMCEAVMLSYWWKYAGTAMSRLELDDLLVLARIHNGGPNGHEKSATLEYARKVLVQLSKREGLCLSY